MTSTGDHRHPFEAAEKGAVGASNLEDDFVPLIHLLNPPGSLCDTCLQDDACCVNEMSPPIFRQIDDRLDYVNECKYFSEDVSTFLYLGDIQGEDAL